MTQPDTPLFKSWDDAGRDIFVPEHYAFQDQEALRAFITANPVGQVISAHGGRLMSTAAPFVCLNRKDESQLSILGHLAARNPQCEAIEANEKALITFTVGGAYISPRWFRKNITAPTWSYVSVQVRGRFLALTDDSQKLDLLDRTVEHMETLISSKDGERAWSIAALTQEQIDRYLTMVKAFEIEVEAVEGVCRLNQDKERVDMEGIIEGLVRQGSPVSLHIAKLMKSNLASVA